VGKINLGRVLLGGLAAGLVMNISEFLLNAVVLAKEVEAALRAINLPPADGSAILKLVLLTFVVGLVTVWLYAALRARLGPGLRTALVTGLLIWFLIFVHSGVVNSTLGIFPAKVSWIGVGWGLIESTLGAITGAWLYRDA
jgi:hypothetical protein